MVFIDCDDCFADGALLKLAALLRENMILDVVMYDFQSIDVAHDNKLSSGCYVSRNSSEMMDGTAFLKSQEVSWYPWLYAFKRQFLVSNKITFAENVRFEDSDFVLKCIAKAKAIEYVPLIAVLYNIYEGQTSKISNDTHKIIELFEATERVKLLAEEELKINKEAVDVILRHHYFKYKINTLRYLWRLPVRDIFRVLKRYRPHVPCRDRLLAFCARHPVVFGCCVVAGKPFFPLLRKLYLIERTVSGDVGVLKFSVKRA